MKFLATFYLKIHTALLATKTIRAEKYCTTLLLKTTSDPSLKQIHPATARARLDFL